VIKQQRSAYDVVERFCMEQVGEPACEAVARYVFREFLRSDESCRNVIERGIAENKFADIVPFRRFLSTPTET